MVRGAFFSHCRDQALPRLHPLGSRRGAAFCTHCRDHPLPGLHSLRQPKEAHGRCVLHSLPRPCNGWLPHSAAEGRRGGLGSGKITAFP